MRIPGKKIDFKTLNAINKKSAIVLISYFVIISLLEIAAYRFGGFVSVAASRIWLGTGIILFIIFLFHLAKTTVNDIKNKNWICLGGILVLIGMYFYFIGNTGYSDINPDAAQQMASGLDAFSQSDWNYTGTAFLSYPCRQYVLNAIPSLIFGRSIFSFHLGFGYFFITGIVLLFLELRSWLRKMEMNENYALLPLYCIAVFRFIPEYYMDFEQAITPVALTMIAAALFYLSIGNQM